MLFRDHYFLAFIILFPRSLEKYWIEVSLYLAGQVKNFVDGRGNESCNFTCISESDACTISSWSLSTNPRRESSSSKGGGDGALIFLWKVNQLTKEHK
jgi:hypothetical protein